MDNKRYIIKQFFNNTFISKIEVFTAENHLKKLKKLLLLPKKNEIITEYYMVKIQVKDKKGLKSYFNFAMSKDKSEKDIHKTFNNSYFNVQVVETIIYFMGLTSKSYEESLRKSKEGSEYEIFIYSLLLKKKYKIIHNCIELKEKDKGIDFIAVKDSNMLLIQCKNWSDFEVEHYHLKEFYANCEIYLSKIDVAQYKIRKIFITSQDVLSSSAKIFLEENSSLFEHHIVHYKI